jgi:osmoprotectant transport system permease protein
VNTVYEALVWLNDPLNYSGSGGVPSRTVEHLGITVASVLFAAVLALPLALWLGHRGRGGGLTIVVGNVSRAIPTLALLTVFAVTAIGFGNRATVVALTIFAIPPLLTNTYVGVRGVDRDVIEAARGMGMSERELLRRIELPLALPLIAAGFRTATVQVVATATLAALVGGGGLGNIINLGFAIQDQGQILAGGMLVAGLALLTEFFLAGVQRAVTPGRVGRRQRRALAARAAAEDTDGLEASPVGSAPTGKRG